MADIHESSQTKSWNLKKALKNFIIESGNGRFDNMKFHYERKKDNDEYVKSIHIK